jgi:hypothetical protein
MPCQFNTGGWNAEKRKFMSFSRNKSYGYGVIRYNCNPLTCLFGDVTTKTPYHSDANHRNTQKINKKQFLFPKNNKFSSQKHNAATTQGRFRPR